MQKTSAEITQQLHARGESPGNNQWRFFASQTHKVGHNADVLTGLVIGKPLIAVALGANYIVLVVEGGAFVHTLFDAQLTLSGECQLAVSLGIGMDVTDACPTADVDPGVKG